MSKILITGASGFIGSALCHRLASDNKVLGIYNKNRPVNDKNALFVKADLLDLNAIDVLCKNFIPEVVIHTAGIAHQKIGAADSDAYAAVNCIAAENLAKAAAKINPSVYFIFLSSVSVYGEKNLHIPVSEVSECNPSSEYAASKLDAEKRLIALAENGILYNLNILRLGPVYDREWSLNLDRRVPSPMNLAYIRFGSGLRKISALARPNLVDFVCFLIQKEFQTPPVNIFNVCDNKVYEFKEIIRIFKTCGIRRNLPVIALPMIFVRLAAVISGIVFPGKRKWICSSYDKLSLDLIFDNSKMLKTGFQPDHSLETVFPSAGK